MLQKTLELTAQNVSDPNEKSLWQVYAMVALQKWMERE